MRTLLTTAIVLLLACVARADIRFGGPSRRPPQPQPYYGTMTLRPYSMTPTWDYRSNYGSYTIRQRYYSYTPTWDVEGPGGYRGTIRQRPYSYTPTWEFYGR